MDKKPRLVVVLDIDDTLLLTLQVLLVAYRQIAREVLGLPERSKEEWFHAWPRPFREIIETVYPELSSLEIDNACNILREGVKDLDIPAVPGAVEAVQRMREVAMIVCLITSRVSNLIRRLEKAKFKMNWFKVVVDGTYNYPKPDRRAFDPIFKLDKGRGNSCQNLLYQ